MIFLLAVIVVQLALLIALLFRLNANFWTWATRDLRRKR